MNLPPIHFSARNIFLLLASTMTVMAGATIAPALPGMSAAFAHEADAEFWVKMILAVPGLCIAICAPMMGWLLDKWHKKTVLIIALACYGVAGAMGYFLHDSLFIILLSRIAPGVAVAGVMVACVTLAGDYFAGPMLGRYMGLQAAFGSFGGVIFLALAGLLADIKWTAPFLIYVFAFIVLPGAMWFLHEPQKKPQEKNVAQPSTPLPKTTLGLCYGLAAFEIFALYMIPLHYPFYASQFGIHDASSIGFAIAGMLLISALVSMNYRSISEHFSMETLHAVGLLILAAGLLLVGFAPVYAVALGGLALMGTGIGIIRPNVIVWLFSFTPPPLRGRVTGGITTFFFIGQFLCPLITKPIIHYVGFAAAFATVGVLSIIIAISLLVAFSTRNTPSLMGTYDATAPKH